MKTHKITTVSSPPHALPLVQILSEDYSKCVVLCTDRSLNFHARGGQHFATRVPKFGRTLAYLPQSAEVVVGGSASELWRLNLQEGRFMAPVPVAASAVNVLGVSPTHGMLAAGPPPPPHAPSHSVATAGHSASHCLRRSPSCLYQPACMVQCDPLVHASARCRAQGASSDGQVGVLRCDTAGGAASCMLRGHRGHPSSRYADVHSTGRSQRSANCSYAITPMHASAHLHVCGICCRGSSRV